MTNLDYECRRLRRLEKRICHLAALLRLMSVTGNPEKRGRLRARVRRLFLRENARLWEMMHPDGEPEDQARKTPVD